MKKDEIIRAWRDQDYFLSLSDDQRSILPANPVGMVELSQESLTNVLGASHTTCWTSCHNSSECCESCWSASCCCCC